MTSEEEKPDKPRMSAATLLVEIASELYTFHRAAQARHRHPGDPEPAADVYARLRDNPDVTCPLEEVRPNLAALYEMRHGRAPSRTDLGDAMTVLLGRGPAR